VSYQEAQRTWAALGCKRQRIRQRAPQRTPQPLRQPNISAGAELWQRQRPLKIRTQLPMRHPSATGHGLEHGMLDGLCSLLPRLASRAPCAQDPEHGMLPCSIIGSRNAPMLNHRPRREHGMLRRPSP